MTARVGVDERADLAAWLTPQELAVFDSMPVADRRHGLDVLAHLRAMGASDRDLLVAGLLHDCGKGPDVRLVHRVGWSLGERYGARVLAPAMPVPWFRDGIERIRHHADLSADLMLAVGVSPRAADLARHQDRPVDPVLGALLRAADDAA